MFNLSGSEIIFLIIIALVVLGPDKLPEAMRKAGKAYGDFKRMTSGFQSEMKSVLDEPMRELRETADLAKASAMFDTSALTKPLSGLMSDVKSATSGTASSSPPAATPATPVKAAEPTPKPAATEPPAAFTTTAETVVDTSAAVPVTVEPVVQTAATVSSTSNGTAPPLAGDATSRRLARMQERLAAATPPAAEPSGPAEETSVE